MVSHYKQRKVTKLDFRKKNVLPKLAQTCPEMAQNEVFGCLLGHNAFIVVDIAYHDQQSWYLARGCGQKPEIFCVLWTRDNESKRASPEVDPVAQFVSNGFQANFFSSSLSNSPTHPLTNSPTDFGGWTMIHWLSCSLSICPFVVFCKTVHRILLISN